MKNSLVKKDRSSAARIDIVRPVACEGGFDGETLAGSKMLRASAKNFPSSRDPGPLRKLRADASGDRVRFEQIFAALELDLPDQATLSRAVRPGKNGQNRHMSGGRPIQLADHTVVAFTRSASNEAYFKFTAIRLFHDIEILFPVPIENRDTSLQCFQAGTRACSDNRGAKPIGKELAILHGSIVDPSGRLPRPRPPSVLINVRSLSGAPRPVVVRERTSVLGGALSIGPFEVTRSCGGRGSYGKCFWLWRV